MTDKPVTLAPISDLKPARWPMRGLDFKSGDLIVRANGAAAARIRKVTLTEIVYRGAMPAKPRRFKIQLEAEVIEGAGTMLPDEDA